MKGKKDNPMNVLVTGGAGFLGSYVMNALIDAGHTPFSYDIAAPGPEAAAIITNPWAQYRIGQVSDQARLFDVCVSEKIEVIVHTAGIVGLDVSLTQPAATYQTNIMGLVNVSEVARQLKMRRLVFASSNAAYHGGSGRSLRETDSVFSIRDGNPAGHYGVSKMAAEAIGITYATLQGLDFVALRVTAIYGFGMRSPMFIKPMVENAVRGIPSHFATGGPMKRDYTYVLDCAEAIARAVDAPPTAFATQRVLNIAAGDARSAAEVASVVRTLFPGVTIEIGNTLTMLEEQNAKMRASLDIGAAKLILDWVPRWSLENGIKGYASRFKAYLVTSRLLNGDTPMLSG
jgi:UDP-glucose 4-epimerase